MTTNYHYYISEEVLLYQCLISCSYVTVKSLNVLSQKRAIKIVESQKRSKYNKVTLVKDSQSQSLTKESF